MGLDKANRIEHGGPRNIGRCGGFWGGKIAAKEQTKRMRRLNDKKIIRQEMNGR